MLEQLLRKKAPRPPNNISAAALVKEGNLGRAENCFASSPCGIKTMDPAPPLVAKSKPIPVSRATVGCAQERIGDRKLEQGAGSARSYATEDIAATKRTTTAKRSL